MGAANTQLVVAESFARIFFRNCVATGELYPVECQDRLCDVLKTGEIVTVDLDKATLTVQSSGKVYSLKPLGEVRPVVDAGGLFNFARQNGMISG
jgi:3-isopropylmalate/(R)-2-methylmalate dehydratase small subunit